MKYHPDVNTTGEINQPNADKFREITEAYSVLSVEESRIQYDLSRKKMPDIIYKEDRDNVMEQRRSLRDNSGHVPAPKPRRGSYADFRLEELKRDREQFNVNHLGYYKGGLPNRKAGSARGTSWATPGYFHDPKTHNWVYNAN